MIFDADDSLHARFVVAAVAEKDVILLCRVS